MNRTLIPLSKENGKKITVAKAPRDGVALTIWAKNDAPKLALWLTDDEAKELIAQVGEALAMKTTPATTSNIAKSIQDSVIRLRDKP